MIPSRDCVPSGRDMDLFWPKVEFDTNGGCWLWSACVGTDNGYGFFGLHGKGVHPAHRVSYAHAHGATPELELDHKCRVRCCVNPAHLEPVTTLENIERSPIHNGAKTRCPQGHEYTTINTRVDHGRRRCRACESEAAKARWARRSN